MHGIHIPKPGAHAHEGARRLGIGKLFRFQGIVHGQHRAGLTVEDRPVGDAVVPGKTTLLKSLNEGLPVGLLQGDDPCSPGIGTEHIIKAAGAEEQVR